MSKSLNKYIACLEEMRNEPENLMRKSRRDALGTAIAILKMNQEFLQPATVPNVREFLKDNA